MTKRIDPLGILTPTTHAVVTARVENVNVGKCPICNKQMQVVDAHNLPAYVCEEDRICLPTQD